MSITMQCSARIRRACSAWPVALLCSSLVVPASAVAAQATHALAVPSAVRAEHQEIRADLDAAMKLPGRVGRAARALDVVLGPHFVREEQIALPPLGALQTLAAGSHPEHADVVLAMADSLRRELPAMLEEHVRIRAAVNELRSAARAERAARFESLSDRLAAHALFEEQVLYPAAIIAGDVARTRHACPHDPTHRRMP